MNVKTLGPESSSGNDYGYNIGSGPDWADPKDCTDCGAKAGWTRTFEYDLTMPSAEEFSGCNTTDLFLHIVLHQNPLNKDGWAKTDACHTLSHPFSIPVSPPYLSIHKSAEGVAQDDGDYVMYSISYRYANGGPVVITDNLPAGNVFRYVKAGPSMVLTGQPSVGATSGTLTWTLPDKTGQPGYMEGTVWFLVELNGDLGPGIRIDNTANVSMNSPSGVLNDTSAAAITTGQAAMRLQKSQSASMLNYGDTVTYYLNWEINGMVLKNVQNFDELTAGTIYNASPPPGWKFLPHAGMNGVWEIIDECGTGDNYIRGNPETTPHYPAMLLEDGDPGNDSDQFCSGMIVSDFKIDDEGYSGADALIIIRSNGQTDENSRMIGILASIDPNPAPGYFMVQQCSGATCSWGPGGMPAMGDVYARQWYRVRINVEDAGATQRIQAKIWPRGDPEPTGWDINTTIAGLYNADWDCRGTGIYNDWRPGVGEQGGDTSEPVKDAYDNFYTYLPRTQSDAFVEDPVPGGINYEGCVGCTGTSPVRWNLGTIANDGGSFTWWGVVDTCDDITNSAVMDSATGEPVYSNEVVLVPICPTPVVTLDKSHSPAGPVGIGDTITWTLAACNSAAGPEANPIYIWDTIPNEMNWGGWIGSPGSGSTTPGGLIQWDVTPLGANQCVTVRWWGTAAP